MARIKKPKKRKRKLSLEKVKPLSNDIGEPYVQEPIEPKKE